MRDQGLGMRAAAAAVALAALQPVGAAQVTGVAADRVWFAPSPGSIDYRRLFEHPEEWSRARPLVSVFKFYQGHTQPTNPVFAPNTYDALVRADAFRRLGQWGIKIAIETGSVKEFFCTPDASGMADTIGQSVASIRSVVDAGGTVAYLAMDEPFVSGRATVCGGPALEPTADRVATYVAGVHATFPAVRIGWIEAYPFSDERSLETALDLLRARGVTPAFLHVDVDSRALARAGADFTRDMRTLKAACAARQVPFGIIIWGYNGDADALYALDAERVVGELTDAFAGWNDMPEHLIFQSWAVSATGLSLTPSNLPDTRAYTHTNLLVQTYRRLRGQTGPTTGTAIPR